MSTNYHEICETSYYETWFGLLRFWIASDAGEREESESWITVEKSISQPALHCVTQIR